MTIPNYTSYSNSPLSTLIPQNPFNVSTNLASTLNSALFTMGRILSNSNSYISLMQGLQMLKDPLNFNSTQNLFPTNSGNTNNTKSDINLRTEDNNKNAINPQTQLLINLGLYTANSIIPNKREYNGSNGGITQSLDATYDTLSYGVSMINPLAGTIMQGGAVLGKSLNALGLGTDSMTKTDAVLGSSFLNLTPIGLINSIGARRAHEFDLDEDTLSKTNGSYDNFSSYALSALNKSNKKYGLFSSGARKRANKIIDSATAQLNVVKNIVLEGELRTGLLNLMSAINSNLYLNQLLGGYDPNSVRIGKHGMSIDLLLRARTILKALHGVKLPYKVWVKDVNPNFLSKYYDLETAYNYLPIEQLNRWKKAVNSKNPNYYMNYKDKLGNYPYHLGSVAPIKGTEDYIFLKKGTEKENPELHWETDTYYNGSNGLKNTHDLVYEGDRYYYRKKKATPKHQNGGTIIELVKESVIKLVNPDDVPEFKNGGSINVIPDGALHARKHNMDLDGITEKGIPVISDGENGKIEQQAEIEKEEIIYRLEVTLKLEELEKKYYSEETSLKEKDEAALEAGKLLIKETLHNTKDNAGLL